MAYLTQTHIYDNEKQNKPLWKPAMYVRFPLRKSLGYHLYKRKTPGTVLHYLSGSSVFVT